MSFPFGAYSHFSDGLLDVAREAATLEEMLAERVAQEATRIAEERIKEMFRVTGFDPDEVFWVHGFRRGR